MTRQALKIWLTIALVILLFAIVLLFTGCYNQRKATAQHGKAVTTFPIIGADYCARTYPCDTTSSVSDTLILMDTVYTGSEVEIYTDTVKINDTVRIVKTVKEPAKIINRTVTIRDTFKIKDRAELDRCNIERTQAIQLATDEKELRKSWEAKAKKRFWIIAAMGAVMAISLFLFIRRKRK